VAAKRILVVDDEPNVVKSCARMLQLEGFEVQGATSGAEAQALYRDRRFDLALVDLKMPDMDGLQLLAALKQYDPKAVVVIFTAYGTKESVVEALRLGAYEFLEKPLDAKTLVATVRRILEQAGGAVVHGNLHSMSLPSIIQINCTERNQARLRVRHGGQEGSIFFADGKVVHAAAGSQVGEEAVYAMLAWEDGDFDLEMNIPATLRTITTGWSGLLLEGMRRLDEKTAGLEELQEIEEKGVKGEMIQDLAKTLRKIEGVTGAVIAARDGIVLTHELEGDPDKEGAVAVFVGNAASQAGEILALGPFEWGTVVVGKDTTVVLEQSDYYVGLRLGERASPAMVVSRAENVLRENGVQ
jgi:CheY-like chemotaxis protein/predicted regulator of Ras-like GTPase activity (Roadblock/LC7/MglB family)